jgi:O-antigen ligase
MLCAACLLLLTVRGWANAVLFLGGVLCAVLLKWGRLPAMDASDRRGVALVEIVLAGPLLAVLLSAAARQDGYWGHYDAPMRFAFALPIFLFALRARLDVALWLRWMLPAALLVLLAARLIQGQPARWPAERMTTGFVDPLVFGYVSLTFGLMAMFSWPDDKRRAHPAIMVLSLVALGLGAYFSIGSQSRTGWLAVPLLVALWLHLHWSRARGWPLGWTALGACALALGAFLFVPTVHARVLEALGEVIQYPWHGGVPPDTPVSLRITYLRIAADLVAAHPLFGVGLTPFLHQSQIPNVDYASPVAIAAAMKSSFHNQVVTETVRFGIGGLVSSIALLVVPLAICLRALGSTSEVTRRNAAMGVAFFTCVLVASFTTEVVDLKYMASFYAVMTALFCGAALARRE